MTDSTTDTSTPIPDPRKESLIEYPGASGMASILV